MMPRHPADEHQDKKNQLKKWVPFFKFLYIYMKDIALDISRALLLSTYIPEAPPAANQPHITGLVFNQNDVHILP